MKPKHTSPFENVDAASIHNKNELVGWIINRMHHVEWWVDIIISAYFNPEKKAEFERVLLNSSILPMGSKMKVLINIPHFDGAMIGKIQKLSAIRNAFAHLPYKETIVITLDENNPVNVTEDNELEVMTSSGKLVTKKVSDYFDEFLVLLAEVKPYLGSLLPKDE